MKGIGIIGEMIPGVILGGILLGVVSSSVLLPPLLYLVAPLLSFAHYSLPAHPLAPPGSPDTRKLRRPGRIPPTPGLTAFEKV
ncbi:MAG TPA: hypothetical protein DDW68_10975 [Verrucomicrobiales bacterium]|mgnify:CR=1 FL=1|nr:hypothetical protein [Verrucomicrobiales bacterium]HBE97681.1 hypothetical protein [Verrucomicrobiales bacterium]